MLHNSTRHAEPEEQSLPHTVNVLQCAQACSSLGVTSTILANTSYFPVRVSRFNPVATNKAGVSVLISE